MKPEVVLELLESAADQLGVRVSYEPIQSAVGTGGLCKVKGEYRVIIDKRATSEERVATIATALATITAGNPAQLDELELPQKIRDVLRMHEPSTRHKRTAA